MYSNPLYKNRVDCVVVVPGFVCPDRSSNVTSPRTVDVSIEDSGKCHRKKRILSVRAR